MLLSELKALFNKNQPLSAKGLSLLTRWQGIFQRYPDIYQLWQEKTRAFFEEGFQRWCQMGIQWCENDNEHEMHDEHETHDEHENYHHHNEENTLFLPSSQRAVVFSQLTPSLFTLHPGLARTPEVQQTYRALKAKWALLEKDTTVEGQKKKTRLANVLSSITPIVDDRVMQIPDGAITPLSKCVPTPLPQVAPTSTSMLPSTATSTRTRPSTATPSSAEPETRNAIHLTTHTRFKPAVQKTTTNSAPTTPAHFQGFALDGKENVSTEKANTRNEEKGVQQGDGETLRSPSPVHQENPLDNPLENTFLTHPNDYPSWLNALSQAFQGQGKPGLSLDAIRGFLRVAQTMAKENIFSLETWAKKETLAPEVCALLALHASKPKGFWGLKRSRKALLLSPTVLERRLLVTSAAYFIALARLKRQETHPKNLSAMQQASQHGTQRATLIALEEACCQFLKTMQPALMTPKVQAFALQCIDSLENPIFKKASVPSPCPEGVF